MNLTEAFLERDKQKIELKGKAIYVGVHRKSLPGWYIDGSGGKYRLYSKFAPMAANPEVLMKYVREVTEEDLNAEDYELYYYDWSDF